MMRKDNIVIVAHKFLTQPDDDLVLFLNEKERENVLHIYHSFSDAPDRKSYAVWYKKGVEYRRFQTADYKNLPEPIIYVKETLFTFWTIFHFRGKWDVYVGMDGLCVLWGNVLRAFGRIKKTVYWAIDFVPEKRFTTGMKNYIYHRINILGYRCSDEMWDLSPRMAEAREKFLGMRERDYRTHRVVPYGMWLERIKRYSYEQCERKTLVFMGHLIEKQGVQLVIDAIPEIIRKISNFKFKIIGDGNYKEELMTLARQKGVIEYCYFLGKIENIITLENEVARSAVAIAPYIKALDTWTYYADPGKIKTYLACGVPVLLTDIPWNAHEIEHQKAGRIIEETSHNIAEMTVKLLDPTVNDVYRNNAVALSECFNYRNIFSKLNV